MKDLIRVLINFYLFIGSCIVPKKKGYWAFVPTHNTKKLTGNPKALIAFIQKNHPEIAPVLINFNKNKQQLVDAKKQGVTTKKFYGSLLWSFLRAEHIILDNPFGEYFIKGNFSLIQLWHGSGFKNVCLLNPLSTKSRLNKLKNSFRKYRMIVTTSEADRVKQNKSFGVNKSVITGYPRNDIFFAPKDFVETIKQNHKLSRYNKIITYAPTFRDYPTSSPFTDSLLEKLNVYLQNQNALLVIKKHPADRHLHIPKEFDHIKDLSMDFPDIQELLLITDQLISDYSSVVTDFAITGRPILIYAYDFEAYKENCRSMYYDLEKVLPKPFIRNEKELFEEIKEDSWQNKNEIKLSYANFRNTFHHYLDGNSSERVVKEILKL